MCTTVCKCDADASLWPTADQSSIVTDSLGVSMVTECPTSYLSSYELTSIVPVLSAMETTFKCAGMCTTSKFYLFSDVSW